jgi:hypothetical protein
VVEIAKRYFGFVPTESSMVVKIGDGLTVCCSDTEVELLDTVDNLLLEETANSDGEPIKESIPIPSNSLSFIALDVDSKDSTVGMSCPPVPFVSIPYLERLRSILVDEGVLAINVSARDPDMLVMAKKQVSEVFTSVFESRDTDADDDDNDDGEALNVVLFCKKVASELPTETMERIEKIQQILPPLSGSDSEAEIYSDLEECVAGLQPMSLTPKNEVTTDISNKSNDPQKKGRSRKATNRKKKGKRK